MNRSANELHEAVKRSLERYFKDMDGERPTSIYDMVLKNIEKRMVEAVLGHAEGNQLRGVHATRPSAVAPQRGIDPARRFVPDNHRAQQIPARGRYALGHG